MFNKLRTVQLQQGNDNLGAGLRTPGFIRQPIPRQGLVGEWLLNSNAQDSSGYGNNGTATNVTYTDTSVGYTKQSGVFNNSTSGVSISGSSLNDLSNFSWCCWVYSNGVTSLGDMPISKNWKWSMVQTNLKVRFNVAFSTTGSDTITTETIQTGWNFLVFMHKSSDKKGYIYINGKEANYDTQTAGVGTITADNTKPLLLGRYDNNDYYWNGNIQYVRVFNRVLSNNEIQALYKEGLKLLH